MTFVYRTSSKDRCGNRTYSSWFGIEAKSKAAVKRRKKLSHDTRVEVLTKEEALALMDRNPNTKIYW